MSGRWFKFNPKAFLEGVVDAGLTPEERGAYITLLCLIYQRGGPIPDDARWLAGNCGISVRAWKILRDALVAKGKISITEDGRLMNDRARRELESFASDARVERGSTSAQARANAASAASRKDKSGETDAALNKNSALAADTTPPSDTGFGRLEGEGEGEREPDGSLFGAGEPAKPKSRRRPEVTIPADFPDQEARLAAREKVRAAGADIDVDRQAERFRNHAEQNDRRCRDWRAAFRNWIEGAIDRAPKRAAPVAHQVGAIARPVSPYAGPPELRAAVIEAEGQNFVAGTLDRCRWVGGDRQLVTDNRFIAERLTARLGKILEDHNITVRLEEVA
jgi:uncharacterized protein YdaU (DUF1376 family)